MENVKSRVPPGPTPRARPCSEGREEFSMENPADMLGKSLKSPLEGAFWLKYLIFQLPARCRLSEVSPWGRRAPTPSLQRIHTGGIRERRGTHSNPKQFLGRETLEQLCASKPPQGVCGCRGNSRTFIIWGGNRNVDAGKCNPEASQGSHDVQRVWNRVCCFPGKLQRGQSSSPQPRQGFCF